TRVALTGSAGGVLTAGSFASRADSQTKYPAGKPATVPTMAKVVSNLVQPSFAATEEPTTGCPERAAAPAAPAVTAAADPASPSAAAVFAWASGELREETPPSRSARSSALQLPSSRRRGSFIGSLRVSRDVRTRPRARENRPVLGADEKRPCRGECRGWRRS